jgi:hypothetical protein
VDLWPSVCPGRIIRQELSPWAGLGGRSALLTPCLSLDVPCARSRDEQGWRWALQVNLPKCRARHATAFTWRTATVHR